MEHILDSALLGFFLWLVNYAIYLSCNHGIAPNARLQQFLRYLPASLVAVLPLAVTDTCVLQPAVVKMLVVAELWALAFPLTYHLTYRKSAPDYDHQIDPVFGIYLFGVMCGLGILLPSWLVAAAVVIAVALPLFLLGYYIVYRHVIDMNGMLLIQQTNYNEIIEFSRSYPLWKMAVGLLSVLAVVAGFVMCGWEMHSGSTEIWQMVFIAVIIVAVGHYMFKPCHSLFSRTGFVKLHLEVGEYTHNNSLYAENQRKRMGCLETKCLHPLDSPHTFLFVIGESASRDFMSAFADMEEDTTPWLRTLGEDKSHCVLFPNAYSCDIQTVPTLEKSLTAFNQYDGGAFYTSTSIVDIAKSLGYRVHWYSNQGHLGVADTPISLVAETSDVAKWTNQQLGKMHYDETLLDFLDEVDTTQNNIVVIHLKGSHFNYENRFPESCRMWGDKGNHDQVTNYKNTIYYTDCVLKRAFGIMREKYNLQGMIYFSDHGDVPDRHRQPNFGGFKDTRIPLMVWMGDDFVAKRPERLKALQENRDKYWTDDLFYDLACGMLDVETSEFKEENSLASSSYMFTRDNLTIMKGTVHISDDDTMEKGTSI